jgi:hypothetical protein
MKRNSMAWVAAMIVAVPSLFGQGRQVPLVRDTPEATQQAIDQEKLQPVLNDKSAYVAAIVRKWDDSVKSSSHWNTNFANDLQEALMKLPAEKLIVANEATSFKTMLLMLSANRFDPTITPTPEDKTNPIVPASLGSPNSDMVYTPLTPCRIIDTRVAGGALASNTSRFFEADVTPPQTFIAQGGSNTNCNLPDNVAYAVAITLTVTNPVSAGFLTAWGLGAQPNSSVINYSAGQTIANTTIVPIVPGPGLDFTLYAYSTTDVVADLVGYFAAPVATALDCTTVATANTPVAVNSWTNIDAFCPVGRTATGGGYNTPEGTLGYPGVWITTLPISGGWRTWVDNQTSGSRQIQTFVNCCRVPGR